MWYNLRNYLITLGYANKAYSLAIHALRNNPQ
jgi:hypothetical protein